MTWNFRNGCWHAYPSEDRHYVIWTRGVRFFADLFQDDDSDLSAEFVGCFADLEAAKAACV